MSTLIIYTLISFYSCHQFIITIEQRIRKIVLVFVAETPTLGYVSFSWIQASSYNIYLFHFTVIWSMRKATLRRQIFFTQWQEKRRKQKKKALHYIDGKNNHFELNNTNSFSMNYYITIFAIVLFFICSQNHICM